MSQLTIALTKGRILQETLPLLAAAGIEPLEDISKAANLPSRPARRKCAVDFARQRCAYLCGIWRG